MALTYRLLDKKGMVQTVILVMELLLLLTGLVTTFFMLKSAINPYYLFHIALTHITSLLNSLHSFLSSPLYICIFVNSVVILIFTFSKFHHHPRFDFLNSLLDNNTEPHDTESEHDHIHVQTPPPPSPRPLSQPPAPLSEHHEKQDKPNRTNSVIAMDTVLSFFSRYSQPHDLDDIDDDIPSVKDIEIDSFQSVSYPDLSESNEIKILHSPNPPHTTARTTTTTKPRSQISWDRLYESFHSDISILAESQSQTSWDRLSESSTINSIPLRNIPICTSPPHKNSTTTETRQTNDQEHVNQENNEESNEHELLSEDDTLDATWKAIIGGGDKKKSKKLKKSETWPVEPQVVVTSQSIGSKDLLPSIAETWKDLRKSVTFNDSLTMSRRGGLRRDLSVSPDESNQNFDNFIKKINNDRMLQRQESDRRAWNLLNRRG